MLSTEREAREKNIIIFNGPEENEDDSNQDHIFFKSICNSVMGCHVDNVKITRLNTKKPVKSRPIKVSFAEGWDKRKFMASLSKLPQFPSLKNVRVAHDMCMEDRQKNKELLKEAYEQNQKDPSAGFKWKVRVPPWAMRIQRIFSKN